MSNSKIVLGLTKGEFVHLFKACEDRAAKLDALQRESLDEDVVADVDNDLVEIKMIMRSIKAQADATWGESGWTTSDAYL
jgi:hypothetical protein